MHEARKPAVKYRAIGRRYSIREVVNVLVKLSRGGMSFEINRKSVKRVVVSCTNNGGWNFGFRLKSIEKAITDE